LSFLNLSVSYAAFIDTIKHIKTEIDFTVLQYLMTAFISSKLSPIK